MRLDATSHLADVLGVAPETPVVVEGLELDARAAAAAARWRLYDPTLPQDIVGASLAEEPAAKKEGFVMSRFTVASTESKLPALVEAAMRADGSATPVEGGELFVTQTGEAVVVRTIAGATEVARVVSSSSLGATDARRVLAALDAWQHPIPESAAPRIELTPPALSLASFWLVTAKGVSPSSVDPVAAARALQEGKIALMVDAPQYEARYSKVVIELEPSFRATVELASRTAPIDPALFSTSGADVDIVGSEARVAINGALLYAWPLLPKTIDGNPYRAQDVDRFVSRNTTRSLLLGGDLPVYWMRKAMEHIEELGQPTLAFMRRFERLGCAKMPGPNGVITCFGLLVASASEEEASCALEREDHGCATTARLVRDKPIARYGYQIVRKKLEGRTVILASRDVSGVTQVKIAIPTGTRPAFTLDSISEGSADTPWDEPFRMVGSLRTGKVVFEATSLPLPKPSTPKPTVIRGVTPGHGKPKFKPPPRPDPLDARH